MGAMYNINITDKYGFVVNGFSSDDFLKFVKQFEKAISLGYHVVDTDIDGGYWVYIQLI